MVGDSGAEVRASKRIAELETALAAAQEAAADGASQLKRAELVIADFESQIDRARINDADLKAQLEAVRVARLHLVDRLQTIAAARQGWWDRLLARGAKAEPISRPMLRVRRRVSRRFLRGSGIEIGALHSPMAVRSGVRVRYVDRLSTGDLRRAYLEWASASFVDVDIIDDGETLETISDASEDFVIASHMLEHCENPLGTMRRHLAKLKPGGVLFYIVPDRRGGFDADRPLTSFDHVVRDDREGPEGSRWDHYLEFSKFANRSPEDQVESIAQQMLDARSSIHFHVWEDTSFKEFLERAGEYLAVPFQVEHFELNHAEIISVLRKTAG